MKIFDRFRKPTIKARLVENGAKAKVDLININTEQVVTLLFFTVNQIASSLKVDPRMVLNRLLDIDSQLKRNKKREEKQARYGKKK